MIRRRKRNGRRPSPPSARDGAARPPDAYKGKGIRYQGETIKLKPGKAAKAAGEG